MTYRRKSHLRAHDLTVVLGSMYGFHNYTLRKEVNVDDHRPYHIYDNPHDEKKRSSAFGLQRIWKIWPKL